MPQMSSLGLADSNRPAELCLESDQLENIKNSTNYCLMATVFAKQRLSGIFETVSGPVTSKHFGFRRGHVKVNVWFLNQSG